MTGSRARVPRFQYFLARRGLLGGVRLRPTIEQVRQLGNRDSVRKQYRAKPHGVCLVATCVDDTRPGKLASIWHNVGIGQRQAG